LDHYLVYFRQRLITHPLSAALPFQSLFTESSHGDQLLAPSAFSGAFTTPFPLCCMFLFSSFFIVQFLFLCVEWGGAQSVQRSVLV
jgi:hypothetical protein